MSTEASRAVNIPFLALRYAVCFSDDKFTTSITNIPARSCSFCSCLIKKCSPNGESTAGCCLGGFALVANLRICFGVRMALFRELLRQESLFED